MQERVRVAVRVGVAIALTAGLALLLAATATWAPVAVVMALPILGAAYLGRWIPGMAATVTGVIVVLLFPAPVATRWLRAAALLVVGTTMTVAIEALHRLRAASEAEKRAALDSNLRFSRLFHASPVAMCLCRVDDGIITEINGAFSRLFGVGRTDIIGRTPREAGIDLGIDCQKLVVKMRENAGMQDELVHARTHAGERTLSVSSQQVELAGPVTYAVATFVDETTRRHAELAAKESQERFSELAANVHEVFWVCDAQTKKTEYMSPAYEEIFQRTIADLDRDSFDWMNVVHHDDRARLRKLIDAIDLRSEARQETTFRVVLRDDVIKTLRAELFPIRDAEGRIVRIGGTFQDVTEQRALEEQVRQSQKLESLGLLAGGVSHDFNNILAVIGSNIGLLREAVPNAELDLVDDVEKAVLRGASLTRQLLAFSRRQAITPVVLDVNRVVDDTRKMLRRMVGEDVKLTCSLDPELRHVMMDAGALVQVMMNLAVNARDAMPRGGELVMATRNIGSEVLLEIADTGCGMPPEVVARIFEPFFTTKGVGKGTGLGLSVVHGIVQQAGGRIEVTSEPGLGTRFSVYFPATHEAAAADAHDASADCRGNEKVLLVDDDVFVRGSAARALRMQGYTVLEAGDGERALELFDEHAASISLLVTDVVMPGMDGRQLVEQARARRPSLKVLYTSGYTDDAVLLHGIQHDRVAFLEKPFRARQLAGSVRKTIDAEGPRVDPIL